MNKIVLGLLSLALSLGAEEIYATFSVVPKQDAKLAFDASGIVTLVNYDVARKANIILKIANMLTLYL